MVSVQSRASVAEVYQQRTVSGVVKDLAGEPMPGVSIVVKGTTTGTITDLDGNFNVGVEGDASVLVISFIGYKTQEVRVGSNNSLRITLEEDTQQIDEVVVVGYGVQKKVNLTGSVSNVSGDRIEGRALTNLSSGLAGLASGVSVSQSSGKPGDDNAAIRIRGISTFSNDYRGPLVIVDGSTGDMNSVNPNDVESIVVLKDAASAAIYGSRGANGVILVTTKRGKQEMTPSVNYTGIVSSTSPSNNFEFLSDYADYMTAFNMARANMGQTAKYGDDTITAWREASKNPNGTSEWGIPNWLAYPNTDWNDAMFQSNVMQNHNLSVTGGSKNTNYLLSLGALVNPGTLSNTAMQRYNVRINVDTRITDFLKVGTQTFMMKEFSEPGSTSFTYMFQTVPGITPMYDGKYGAPEGGEEAKNVNNILRDTAATQGKITKTRINTSWYAEIDFFKDLKGKFNANYQEYSKNTDTYSALLETYTFRDSKLQATTPTLDAATVDFALDRVYQYTLTGTLNYAKTFGDHDINVLAGYEQYYYNTRTDKSQKKGLMDFSIHDMQAATEMVYINYDASYDLSERDYGMLSWFGRLNYGYKDRYLFEMNLRRDGSSRFSPEARWGTFPSFSAGWRITEEAFMAGTRSWLDNLKLRLSWGKLGNVTSGYYDWQSTYSSVNNSIGGAKYNGLAVTKIGNSAIHWENINSTGIGIDASFLDNHLNLELDFYNKITEGILTTATMPLTMGTATAPTENTADMRNRGVDITLGWNDHIKDFRYGVNVNFSYNQNEVIDYLGKYEAGWEGDEYVTNFGKTVSYRPDDSSRRIRTEGHVIDEWYIRTPYVGTGTYTTGGAVDPKGGPKDGMIRTEADMQWVKDMQAAGYTFAPKNNIARNNLYYGEYIYADLNGDKIYGNDNDRQFTGKSATPKVNLGINLNAAWKGFDFSMTWAGSFGMYNYISDRGVTGSTVDNGEQISKNIFNDYYYYNESDPNDPLTNLSGRYPSLKFGTGTMGNYAVSTVYLYNSSFMKLRNVQLGYTLPKDVVKKLRAKNLRVFVSGENLLTLSKDFPGLDPEIGMKINAYPLPKQFSAGVNVTF
jgi:TonB-linked SusC/RagA family outer membrane protein